MQSPSTMAAYTSSLISIAVGLYFLAVGLGAPLPPAKFRRRKWVTICGVLIMVGGLAEVASTPSQQQSNAELLARAVKAKFHLPYKIDEITTLDDVESGADGVTYVMTVLRGEAEAKEIVGKKRRQVSSMACRDVNYAKILKAGVHITMLYRDRDGKMADQIIVAPKDCGS